MKNIYLSQHFLRHSKIQRLRRVPVRALRLEHKTSLSHKNRPKTQTKWVLIVFSRVLGREASNRRVRLIGFSSFFVFYKIPKTWLCIINAESGKGFSLPRSLLPHFLILSDYPNSPPTLLCRRSALHRRQSSLVIFWISPSLSRSF